MTPRWIKTKDHEPSPHRPNYGDDDLLSGAWVVGRVLPAYGTPNPGQYNWNLTGAHTPQAPVSTRGACDSADTAKAELFASWRRW